jgi:class 3 adenylate cyclase/Tfp pilus assembly protein PilF
MTEFESNDKNLPKQRASEPKKRLGVARCRDCRKAMATRIRPAPAILVNGDGYGRDCRPAVKIRLRMARRQPRSRVEVAKNSGRIRVVAEARPTGTVTFAFTDIEGSTARWERDRLAMHEAVRRHDEILRAVIVERRGYIFKALGDAFYSAFARPQDALVAMLAAQRQLAAEDFSAVDGLRMRAAIHTGTADQRDGDYFGPAVNKVARLLAIGHGGQILLTDAAATLVAGDLPSQTTLHDLGAYHLKDFAEPERVHQLVVPGLVADFPPLRSLGTLPSDLSIVDVENFHSVPSFSGRGRELAMLASALAGEPSIAVVHGLGGVGKSTLARECAWRNRDAFSILWWLNAQTEEGIIDGFLRLGAMFHDELDRIADRRAAATRVVNSLLGGFDKPVLLVFDNLEDERLLRAWLPRTGVRALVTSRDAMLGDDAVAIPLQTWQLDTAIEYLQRESGRADLSDADARAIATAVGALPLALAHAAASLRRMRMVSPQRYIANITEHLKNAPRNAEYPQSVFATFTTAIAQAEREAAGAAAVLCFAARFAPDAIPDELFRQSSEEYPPNLQPKLSENEALDLHSVVADERHLDEALGALDRLSLLAFSQGARTYNMHRLVQLAAQDLVSIASARPSRSYSVHRLVQMAARDLTSAHAQAWREAAVVVANAAFPPDEFRAWPRCERLLPHARAALEALPAEPTFLRAGDLAFRCALYLWRRGDYHAAETLHRYALRIREKLLGPDHPDVATSATNLAIACGEQGRHEEASQLFARALAIRETALGPDAPLTANSRSNLAHAYHDLGRCEEAEALYSCVCASHEKMFGPDHPDVATAINNLASVYCDEGRFDEAEPLHRRALAIREKAFGLDHPDVAVSLGNLAEVYLGQGRYSDAESFQVRALRMRETALGPDHPDIAKPLLALADVRAAQGRVGEARALYARALAIREKAFGADHPKAKELREKLNPSTHSEL